MSTTRSHFTASPRLFAGVTCRTTNKLTRHFDMYKILRQSMSTNTVRRVRNLFKTLRYYRDREVDSS
jgi:hypothetical protein